MEALSLLDGGSIRLGWRDRGQDRRSSATANECVERGSSSKRPSLDTDLEGFLTHTVSKRDTLAGLAIRYNVSPADIKRFNGMISDTDMYAHGKLLIPTKLLPLTEEARAMFVHIVARVGHPATRLACSSQQPAAPLAGPVDDEPEPTHRCSHGPAAASYPGHVEMVDMSGSTASSSSARGRMDADLTNTILSPGFRSADLNDQVRRRWTPDAVEQGGPHPTSRSSEGARPVPSNWGQQRDSFLTTVGRAIGGSGSAVMQKLPTGAQLSLVADGVMVSLRSGLLPKGNLPTPRYNQEWLQVHALPPTASASPRSLAPPKQGKCD